MELHKEVLLVVQVILQVVVQEVLSIQEVVEQEVHQVIIGVVLHLLILPVVVHLEVTHLEAVILVAEDVLPAEGDKFYLADSRGEGAKLVAEYADSNFIPFSMVGDYIIGRFLDTSGYAVLDIKTGELKAIPGIN